MPQRFQINCRLAVLVLAGVFASTVFAQQEPDIEYAQQMPLVTRSLLLDIVALSDGGFVAVGERGHVVYSANGINWTQAAHVPTRSTLTTVDEFEGRLWAAGHDAVILTSGDGGVTWTRQYFDAERQQAIMDIHFFDESNGLAVGSYGLALFSSDGGATWDDGMINEEEWHNNAVRQRSDDRIMVAGEAGFAYRSEDMGESWETLDLPYAGSMFGIVETFNNCSLLYGLRGHVQESCDFGDNWSDLDSGSLSSITGAVFMLNETILVGNSGLILRREDDGPLRTEYHSSGVDFAAIATSGDGRFVLVGEDGIHHFPEISRSEP